MDTKLHTVITTKLRLGGSEVYRKRVTTKRVHSYEHSSGTLQNNKSRNAQKLELKLEQLEHEFRANVRVYDIEAKRKARKEAIAAKIAAKGRK